jgi:hypothetical protein
MPREGRAKDGTAMLVDANGLGVSHGGDLQIARNGLIHCIPPETITLSQVRRDLRLRRHAVRSLSRLSLPANYPELNYLIILPIAPRALYRVSFIEKCQGVQVSGTSK